MSEVKAAPSQPGRNKQSNQGPKGPNQQARKGKKPFKKKGKKKAIPVVKRGDPTFTYTSVCCGSKADKAPCERSPEDSGEGNFSQSPLGKWKCTSCRRTCKVTRSKNKPVEEVVEVSTN